MTTTRRETAGDPIALVCFACDEPITDCELCDEPDCPRAICYGCIRRALGETMAQPHVHGG